MLDSFQDFAKAFSSWIWDWPLLVLLVGGGLFLLFYSKFIPFKYLKHAIHVIQGKYDKKEDHGELSHFEALSSAIAATVGLGNISGVAIAIVTGGPGAIFWMWMSAIVGMATKFFTCTLSVMYRKDLDEENTLAGPMYVITEGLGKKWKPLAIFFSLVGLIGVTPAFQANQLTATFIEVLGTKPENQFITKLIIGCLIAVLVGIVIFGGLKRIGKVTSKLVPFMVIFYMISVFIILGVNYDKIPAIFNSIFSNAFTANAAIGGGLGYIIKTGVKRAAFSNEAGIGTAPMMHGHAKTKEPIREGLVAMLGPFIDTIVVCSLTAFMILSTGVADITDANGVSLTLSAFKSVFPNAISEILLLIAVLIFSLSTMFTFSYYGDTCLGFLTKPKYGHYYRYFYVAIIIVASIVTLDVIVNIVDSFFAMMAIPTVISTVLLAPKVRKAADIYFKKLKEGKFG
ncbi:alanine/glycine:cation symporter family protein [Aureivirga sp. CE67]|uniref:alanine/glycine:cation symporter family protein n=1 Tax=Aureivirga sp. CE67 TaxID=1788983 RepID=UPI0018C9A992|nr:alanine/glycine:cation symporter family protein [Aureivirga sp. CE67]